PTTGWIPDLAGAPAQPAGGVRPGSQGVAKAKTQALFRTTNAPRAAASVDRAAVQADSLHHLIRPPPRGPEGRPRGSFPYNALSGRRPCPGVRPALGGGIRC